MNLDFCMFSIHLASGILHGVVDVVCHSFSAESMCLSWYDQSLSFCSDVAFIEPLISEGHACDVLHNFMPEAMQRLLILNLSWYADSTGAVHFVIPLLTIQRLHITRLISLPMS